jgi:glucose-6-phosphate 1-dehydrogenase
MNRTKDFVLFGASGDLARKKLYPALYQNYLSGLRCRYIGYGRTQISDDQFRDIVSESTSSSDLDFLSRFSYVSGGYNRNGLKSLVSKVDPDRAVYYLAIPNKYEIVSSLLTGLISTHLFSQKSFVVFEKPFGEDYESAEKLIEVIEKQLGENKVFLIDHYLAKDLVRNLISVRFANPMIESLWSNKFIKEINISIEEEIGIEKRGEYYDSTGAIRDMIQNHGLQLLSLVTMDIPKTFGFSDFHGSKEKIVENVRFFNGEMKNHIEIGQYDGYRGESGVDKKSLTETYSSLLLEVASDRWNGVPIRITTGKKLRKKYSAIEVVFKENEDCIWKDYCDSVDPNSLMFEVYPKNEVRMKLNVGFDPKNDIPKSESLVMDFSKSGVSNLPYVNAIRDVYNNEKSYSPSFREVLLSWKFADGVLSYVDKNRERLLKIY